MKIVTHWLHPDEPCHGLREGPRNGRWVQRVYVVRGDSIAEWSKDYGPVSDWPDATEIGYISLGDDSVAQLQEMAERDRHSDKWAKRRREMQAESTLIPDILRQEEELLDVVRNRSHFGPKVAVQRNDFPREAVKERSKEKRNARKSRNR
jgi:hypothetical protein